MSRKTKSLLIFTPIFVLAILFSGLSRSVFMNMPNEDAWIAGLVFQAVIYVVFIIAIYLYGRYNSFTRKKYSTSYTILFISFLIFPVILQIATYIYVVRSNSNKVAQKINNIEKTENKIFSTIKDKIITLTLTIKDKIGALIFVIFILFLMFSYFFGGYKLFTDSSYSTKQLIAGIVFPPYTIYVGADEIFSSKKETKNKKTIEVKR